jgi:dTDP-4-amino-4,6-dideoxygalactose transaminase
MKIKGNSIIREFEYKLSKYLDVNHVLSVCNASIGILGTVYSLGLSNEEVISSPLTWYGALAGLIYLNCNIKFCDVEPDNLTIDPLKLESVITNKTKAVISNDFLGYPAKLDEIKKICKKYNLFLIHDAASSFGSRYKNHFSGRYADVTILSFGLKKLFSTGEGGGIVTNDKKVFDKILINISSPDRQNLEINKTNYFALNTAINLLAAEYGINTFEKQIENIKRYRDRVIKKLIDNNISLIPNSEPNYYKILFRNNLNMLFQAENKINIKALPYDKLVYKITNKFGKNRCPIAEWAINNTKTIEFN